MGGGLHDGITPAWAGKSQRDKPEQIVLGDHPRVGGEKPVLRCRTVCRLGSPPRGRGKGIFAILALSATGITPAWAGKSLLPVRIGSTHEDHPRVGGEKSPSARISNAGIGSPPRGRGKAAHTDELTAAIRITPAWAGKRPSSTLEQRPSTDHPRVGGEKTKKIP